MPNKKGPKICASSDHKCFIMVTCIWSNKKDFANNYTYFFNVIFANLAHFSVSLTFSVK